MFDFFEQGGTSLTVAVLVAALADRCAGLSFQDVVQHPTPRSLAAYITASAEKAQAQAETVRDYYPLTKTQMGIYLEGLTGGNSATYTVPFLIRTDPSVTADALIAAVKAFIAAHPSMKYVIRDGADEICQQALTADVLVFATPIYYYEMSGQLKTLLDRLNPLFPSDYAFTDVYLLSSAAEDEDHVPQRAVSGVEGWIECFDRARLAGTLFLGGVTEAGEAQDHPEKLQAAYAMGRTL